MMIHPPCLYLGYVGLAVPFAFAVAALITGRLDDAWIRSTRRWMLFPWFFLGIGILLGGRWAYVELGWGGYWAWDRGERVAHAWLAATALHSVMIQEKRNMMKFWNYFSCPTFLRRSSASSSPKDGSGAFFTQSERLCLFISSCRVRPASLIRAALRGDRRSTPRLVNRHSC
jgi:cytochrome c biogenesis factor